MGFKDKVVVITGAAQGIGKQIALDFAQKGAIVCMLDITAEALSLAEKELSAYSKVSSFVVDASIYSKVGQALDKIIDKYGKIDILVNNAGITRDSLLLRLKEEDWDKVIAVNLKSVFNCSKAALKYMVKSRSGKIISISSVIALMGNPGQTNYGSSKAAIIGFTKSLAKEVASRGICVNAVAPGYIRTAMTDKIPEDVKSKMLDIIPARRFGEAKDVSGAVLFLASSAADYITGKVIVVDGGMT
ncbi:MAG: 3-oxoacyl-[acyl-carrier-protein] reductase [Candidatus Omnitrophica bacterium]|nr:3-oxoacyl-[acyl-carrier-protein] reductase [Candidatus Omnitrophota bacterium]